MSSACKQTVPGDAAAFLWIRPLALQGFKHGNVGLRLVKRSDTTRSYKMTGPSIGICECESVLGHTGVTNRQEIQMGHVS